MQIEKEGGGERVRRRDRRGRKVEGREKKRSKWGRLEESERDWRGKRNREGKGRRKGRVNRKKEKTRKGEKRREW